MEIQNQVEMRPIFEQIEKSLFTSGKTIFSDISNRSILNVFQHLEHWAFSLERSLFSISLTLEWF